MDSLAAVPGTGPNTSPLPTIRAGHARATWDGLPTDRAVVFGILNVTPDSFSDGGTHDSLETAIGYGLRMFYNGADVIDVGGESTRPGAAEVDTDTEQKRVLPVVQALVKAGALVSVDTRHAETAQAAIDEGALIINDVSGLKVSKEMIDLVARTKVHYILMHSRGDSRTMDSLAQYQDVVSEVVEELTQIRDSFRQAGATDEQIIVDPGLGFSKTGDHNWTILANLDRFTALGHRVLVGASRKRFLGSLLTTAGKAAAPTERDNATLATTSLAVSHGAWAVRVHDAPANLDAVKVVARLAQEQTSNHP